MDKIEKKVVSIDAEHVSQLICAKCQKVLDVSHLSPFTKIKCPDCGTSQIIPAKFASFLLIKQLGAGGMGVIYQAIDRELGRQVALKVMKRSLGDNEEFVQSFRHEAQAAAALNHRNVVQIYSFGQYNGQPYIVMELMQGGKLDDLIADGGGIDELKALKIHIEVTEGLMAASDVGLVHGDVKPANVLFGKTGEAKVVDFGLASYISDQKKEKPVWGTPYYIAPEKARGKKVDFRSDIYSLGATLFHALTGKPPFDGSTANDVVMARLDQPAPDILSINPGLHPETAKMVARMLETDPAMRYPSYPALLVDMHNAFEAASRPLGRQSRISSVAVPIRVSETKIRSLMQKVSLNTMLAAGGIILFIAVGAGWWVYNNKQQARLKQEATDRQLFTQARDAGLGKWDNIINLAIMITEIATNATPLAERADKLAESINRVDEPLAKIIEETDKIKEGLNESEDLWMIAAVAVRQLEKASDRQTAERLRDEIEKTFDQLVAIYGAAQESGELAKEVMVQANVTHQKALEEISRQKAEKARQEALQRQAEAEKLQAQQKAEELKKLRPTFVQKEFDELEKYRGASASLILRRKFSEAKRSFAAVRSKITLDEAVTLFKNVEETYTEIAKLQEWLIKMINSATCKNGWLMGESGQDITKASEEDGLTIELGSLGKSVIQWEAVPVNQWLRIVNYYVDPTKLSDSQRATIFKQTALFCYENGVFKTAETYANEAVKADPGLLPDLNRLMPGIVSAK